MIEKLAGWFQYTGTGIDFNHIMPYAVIQGGNAKVSIRRILEALIPMALVGLFIMHSTQTAMTVQIEYLNGTIVEMKTTIGDLQRSLDNLKWEISKISGKAKP